MWVDDADDSAALSGFVGFFIAAMREELESFWEFKDAPKSGKYAH